VIRPGEDPTCISYVPEKKQQQSLVVAEQHLFPVMMMT